MGGSPMAAPVYEWKIVSLNALLHNGNGDARISDELNALVNSDWEVFSIQLAVPGFVLGEPLINYKIFLRRQLPNNP